MDHRLNEPIFTYFGCAESKSKLRIHPPGLSFEIQAKSNFSLFYPLKIHILHYSREILNKMASYLLNCELDGYSGLVNWFGMIKYRIVAYMQ